MEPASNTTLPATLSVPIEWPGATVPPAAIVVGPTVPVPVSRAPERTVVALRSVPSTTSAPPSTLVMPV